MSVQRSISAVFLGLALLLAGNAHAQFAGSTTLKADNLSIIATGWSVKKKVLGKTVYNEENKKVGKIDDLIVAPDGTASFFIVGAGGFLGVAKHDVAIAVGMMVVIALGLGGLFWRRRYLGSSRR